VSGLVGAAEVVRDLEAWVGSLADTYGEVDDTGFWEIMVEVLRVRSAEVGCL